MTFRLLRRVILAARLVRYSFHAWSAARRAAKGRVPDAIVFTTCTVAVQFASVYALRRRRFLIGVVHEGPSSSRLAKRVLAAFTSRRGYAIGCMSSQLVGSYTDAGADPRGVGLVPNPVVPLNAWPEVRAAIDAVGYLGNAREEKGFDFLVAALPALLDVGSVLVQCYATGAPTPKIREAMQSLHQIESPRLQILEGSTSESRHSELIAGVAAVLLPYVPKDYGIGRDPRS